MTATGSSSSRHGRPVAIAAGPPSAPPSRSRGRSPRHRGTGADLAVVAAGVALVVAAALVGRRLIADGVNIFLGFPPLIAGWSPRVGVGSAPALVLAAAVVLAGVPAARRWRWRTALLASWAASAGWITALALVDGWQEGIAGRLTAEGEYLFDIPKVHSVAGMLRMFTDHMLTNQPLHWTTHVGGHPPGAFLVFLLLDRAGLGGGGPAGALCILVGASIAPALAVTLRALGAEDAARAMLPFAVLTPAAVWVGVSADGMFAGVLAWAVALLAVAATRRGRLADAAAAGAGMLGGATLYLSYGLVLGLLIMLAVPLLTRRVRPAVLAGIAGGAVAVGFTLAGFWWFRGFELVRLLYAASIARARPYEYFWWADLAALAFMLGPAVLAGLRRLPRCGSRTVTVLVAAGLAAILLADLSGLSKGEVERIWLPFAVWLIPACGLLPARQRWLAAQAVLALAVAHLLTTPW